ncbi:Tubulin-specific chaperone A [Armadillidium nasatum]|uniref:Tubulin-specific chaperone A n=1 Tax=Armadillidium nasatum TaxID=96803 RepID=A0A5N5SU70_9CRUS|nr:Tubulin-specific chaperone A [Armadillidium nasatum]
MSDPRIRQIKIKTGVLSRTAKEKLSYEKEADQIMEKIKKMQDEGKEVYYIKKQDELLQETTNVVADCQRRVNAAYSDLKSVLENESELEETEEYAAAKAALEVAKPQVTA